MKKSRFSETQIVSILQEADASLPVTEVCRKYSISSPTYYKWKAKYGGLGASELKRIRALEAENARLKRMYADKAMEADALKDVIEKNSRADREARSDQLFDRSTQAVDLPGLCIGGAVPVGVVLAAD